MIHTRKLVSKIPFWLICFGAGALLSLAFAPWQIASLTFFMPAILFYAWFTATNWYTAAGRSLAFGCGLFGAGTYWIFISIHNYGHLNTFLASIVTLLFIGAHASLIALPGAWLGWFQQHHSKPRLTAARQFIILYPLLWLFTEGLRTHLWGGFPWLLLGSAHTDNIWREFIPLIGVNGLSWICAIIAGVIGFMLTQYRTSPGRLIILCIILFILSLNNIIKIAVPHWTTPLTPAIRVSLIQGNIPQGEKWDPARLTAILDRYVKLTAEHWQDNLIVWPEGAIPLVQSEAQAFLDDLTLVAKEHHLTIISGLAFDIATDPTRFYNGLIALGASSGKYYKRHLVPFGEYLPWSFLSIIVDRLHIPMANFTPGNFDQPLIRLGHLKLASYVCYEIAYSHEVLSSLNNANIIINISDDSWFGHSTAAAQQFQLARMRALETGRPVLTATNSGITAIINEYGEIKTQALPYTTAVVTQQINGTSGQTPFMLFNQIGLLDNLWWLIGLFIICRIFLVGFYYFINRKR